MKIETIRKYSTRKNILIILAILILLLIFMGVTYSFYSAKVKFVNNSQTIIKTNELNLIYTGAKEITAESIIPGDSFTKKFTVENKSNVATTFNIYMENITNEFNEDLVYILSDEDGEVVSETPLPVTNNDRSYLVSNIKIESLEIKTYTLKIEFKYLDTPQNDYQGKYFKAILGIDANEMESAIPQLACQATKCLDNDRSGDISIGDLITYDTESFYVYSIGTDIKMLAEYNIEVGNSTNSLYPVTTETNLQSEKTLETNYGVLAFSSDNIKGTNYSDYEGSIVQSYVDIYKNKLIEKGVEAKEVTLITLEELRVLGCSSGEYTCKDAPKFIYTTQYWTKTNYDNNNIWCVRNNKQLSFIHYQSGNISNTSVYGIRPVLIVSSENL